MAKSKTLETYLAEFEKRQQNKGTVDAPSGGILPNPDAGECLEVKVLKAPQTVTNEKLPSGIPDGTSLVMRVELTALPSNPEKYRKRMADKVFAKIKNQVPPDQQAEIREAIDNSVVLEVGKDYDVWVPDTLLKTLLKDVESKGLKVDKKELKVLVGKKINICGTFFIFNNRPAKALKGVVILDNPPEKSVVEEEDDDNF